MYMHNSNILYQLLPENIFTSRRLRTIESNHPMTLVFIQKRLSIKHNGRAPGYLRPVLQT